MERVAFIVESTGDRLNALLNPEHVEIERVAGLRRRSVSGGLLTGTGRSDDRLLYSGGGVTRLKLRLLFDVTLATRSEHIPNSVRELTAPFWNLSENQGSDDAYGRPPLVRFVWGKSWNLLGLVSTVAERLEYFDTNGAPRRSWLALTFVRVTERENGSEGSPLPAVSALPEDFPPVAPDEVAYHEVLGVGSAEGGIDLGEQIDAIAFRYYGDPAYWRLLAAYNELEDPTRLEAGTLLRIPPRHVFEAL